MSVCTITSPESKIFKPAFLDTEFGKILKSTELQLKRLYHEISHNLI